MSSRAVDARVMASTSRGLLATLAMGAAGVLLWSGCGGSSRAQRVPAEIPGAAIRPVSTQPPVGTLTQVSPGPLPPKQAPARTKAAADPNDTLRAMPAISRRAPPLASDPGPFPAFGDSVRVDEPPEPTKRVHAGYPALAREAGVQGTVVLRVLVGADGRVHGTRLVNSIPMLDSVVVAAVSQWRFAPAQRDGKPIATWFRVPFKFSLN